MKLPAVFCRFSLVALAALPAAALAQDLEPLPEPPPMPEAMTPEQAITAAPAPVAAGEEAPGGTRFDEYSYQNHVYMVRVTPPSGTSYYLLDQQSDGRLGRYQGKTPMLSVPMWNLHSW
ncbi:MAG: DUF2782 domain-containing protein [Rhodocyclaceae bacterium]|nr:DUF2782 domain-containing protein [Rhodocyclaceae bacterium]